MKKNLMKLFLFVGFFVAFVAYVVLGGVDDFLVAETKYINSEIQLYKQNNNFKTHEYVSLQVVKEITQKYRQRYNKQQTIIKNQEKRVWKLSALTFFIALFAVFFLNAGYIYIIIFLIPFMHFFNQLFTKTGYMNFHLLVLPSIALSIVCMIKYLRTKKTS